MLASTPTRSSSSFGSLVRIAYATASLLSHEVSVVRIYPNEMTERGFCSTVMFGLPCHRLLQGQLRTPSPLADRTPRYSPSLDGRGLLQRYASRHTQRAHCSPRPQPRQISLRETDVVFLLPPTAHPDLVAASERRVAPQHYAIADKTRLLPRSGVEAA